MNKRHIGILGGSFNPVHNMHINIALDAYNSLKLDSVELLPCSVPVHKSEILSQKHRVELLKLAIKGIKGNININMTEIDRGGNSYTVDTILDLKRDDTILSLIIGSDSLNNFTKWKNWQLILNNCNLIVAKRADAEINIDLELSQRITDSIYNLFKNESGKIFIMPRIYENISATKIRMMVKSSETTDSLDKEVIKYILRNNLYTK